MGRLLLACVAVFVTGMLLVAPAQSDNPPKILPLPTAPHTTVDIPSDYNFHVVDTVELTINDTEHHTVELETVVLLSLDSKREMGRSILDAAFFLDPSDVGDADENKMKATATEIFAEGPSKVVTELRTIHAIVGIPAAKAARRVKLQLVVRASAGVLAARFAYSPIRMHYLD